MGKNVTSRDAPAIACRARLQSLTRWPPQNGCLVLERRENGTTLLRVSALFNPITLGQFSYVTGVHGVASTLAIFGSVFIGMILLPRRSVYSGLPVWCLMIILCDWASREGILPWRELFLQSLVGGEATLWQEVLRNSILLFVMGGVMVYALDQLIESWCHGEKRLEKANRTDALTGIYNRWHVLDLVDQALRESDSCFSVVMVDVDHFKSINDRFEHKTGDNVLKEVSRALRRSLRREDILGRFGGEEFVALISNASSDQAATVVERCRNALHELTFAEPELKVTASFGVVANDFGDFTLDELVDAANKALYQAKSGGRDRVMIYNGASGRSTPSTAFA